MDRDSVAGPPKGGTVAPGYQAEITPSGGLQVASRCGVLAVLWLLGVVAFHITTFAIYILIVVAVIALIAHFVTGARSKTRV